jgi:L-lactate dehydrogenase complex protein LldF
MEHLSPEFFADNVDRALADDELRGALRRATDLFSARRREALSKVPDWEELRTEARRIKDETLADLDRHLEQFVENAEAAGVQIHRAVDAEAARRIVEEIARNTGTTEAIVKSKSMTTEEIELNEFLEARGLHALETDLGEWIIQLAEERPSHIIVPAIHKTRAQIGKLFSKHLQTDPSLDAQAMTVVAREFLRERFAAADVGISGVNFAVAETGSILLLENEGNIRLTTSLPRVHIALMGIEKVIPRLADLAVFLRLLPRSGTGQHLTSYQSILTGTKRRPADEGPEEVHIVLLDNGRSGMLASPVTRQSLACIRCGACLNACPVYQQIGGHAYGSVYPGPIGAIITPQLNGGENADALPFASSLCGACVEVCPVKIDIPELLLHLRAESRERGSRMERFAFRMWARVSSSRRAFEWGSAALRLLSRAGLLGVLPPVRAWRRERNLRPIAAKSFRRQWASGLSKTGLSGRDDVEVGRAESEAAPRAPETLAERDALERFVEMVHSVGGQCHQVDDHREVLDHILQELDVSSFVCSDAALLRDVRPEGRVRVEANAERSELLRADAGISTAQWGIAETGTLVLMSDDERHRLASLLPPVHIAVLSRSRIVATLDDAFASVGREKPEEMSRAITFITGPSRTADIELTLVVGVHGPGVLHVIVIP